MKSLKYFIHDYPLPPAIQRGQRRQFSVSLDNEELELLQEIAYHPSLRDSFGGHVSDVIRWCIYHTAEGLLNSADAGIKNLASRLKDSIEIESMEYTLKSVDEWFLSKARKIDLCLRTNYIDGAFEVYEETVAFIQKQPLTERRILEHCLSYHPELSKQYSALLKEDPHRLRTIDEETGR